MDLMWLRALPTSSKAVIITHVLYVLNSILLVPQRKHIYKDKNTGVEKYADVRMGDLYQATKQKVERLRQNRYKVVEMWEHD